MGLNENMKLYQVKYGVWNHSFSKLSPREQLSVGNDETEAIARVKEVVDKDAREFSAQEISSVFGYEINVQDSVIAQHMENEPTDEMDSEEGIGQSLVM